MIWQPGDEHGNARTEIGSSHNYTGITLLLHWNKIYETLLAHKITKKKVIIIEKQHAFHRDWSTTDLTFKMRQLTNN
jgi:hypothetical protein